MLKITVMYKSYEGKDVEVINRLTTSETDISEVKKTAIKRLEPFCYDNTVDGYWQTKPNKDMVCYGEGLSTGYFVEISGVAERLKKRVENPKMTSLEYTKHLLSGKNLRLHCEFCGDEYHDSELFKAEADSNLPSWRLCEDCAMIRFHDEAELVELIKSLAHKRVY